MELNNKQQFYFGVYGLCFRERKVLTIKKARGPYIGLFDLPGGSVEFKETVEDALKREFKEEVGGDVIGQTFLGYNQYFTTYKNKNNEIKDFHHVGLYFKVDCLIDNLKEDADGQDSLGAVFVEIDKITKENCSPMAFEMIQKAKIV